MDPTKIFLELAAIPSPSLHEEKVAAYIKSKLDDMRISSHFDNTFAKTKSSTGNLIARIGSGKPSIMFVAHMDTVEEAGKPVKLVVKDNLVSSDGTTIIGSDDKSGIAAMLCALERLKNEPNLPTIYFVFSTTEESGGGGMGATYLDVGEDIDYAFSIDGSDTPGKFISKSLGYQAFSVKIRGKAAHAAQRPEEGANAVKAAGIMIANLSLSKDANGASINVHRIEGRATTEATVPDAAGLYGAFRGFSKQDMDGKLEHIKNVAEDACNATGCTYELVLAPVDNAPPFLARSQSILELAEKATKATGLGFSTFTLYSPSEANVLSAKGWPTLGMCRGGRDAHSVKEHLDTRELEQTMKLIVSIAETAKNL